MVDVAARLDPAREEAELREYLGDGFDRERLVHYERQLDDEFASCGHEDEFYRTSEAYLYNLTAFAMTGTKIPYLEELARHVRPGSKVLDYGCGIGSDGLLLLELGYDVAFADFDNPSVEYLRWRLGRRGREAVIYDVDRNVPGGFDAAYAFDVIEHVDDPFAFLGELEHRARLVLVNVLESDPDDTVLHHDLPVDGIVARAASNDLVSYKVLHERSHLLCYRPGRPGVLGRARAKAKVAAVRARRR